LFGEGSLGNDFACRQFLGLEVSKLIALGEPPFAQELATKVLLYAYVAVKLNDLLFDNDLGVVRYKIVFASCAFWFCAHL